MGLRLRQYEEDSVNIKEADTRAGGSYKSSRQIQEKKADIRATGI